MNVFIGVAKGELGKDIEIYLKQLGIKIELDSNKYTQRRGNNIFSIMRSRDVPKFVGNGNVFGIRYGFGITGNDCCEDELLGGNNNFVYLDELDFGKGTLGFLGRTEEIPEKPRIITGPYYLNLVRKFVEESFDEYSILIVNGATEGYVARGEADIAFDCVFEGKTLEANELCVIKEIMPTQAVVIGAKGYTIDDFYKYLKGYK